MLPVQRIELTFPGVTSIPGSIALIARLRVSFATPSAVNTLGTPLVVDFVKPRPARLGFQATVFGAQKVQLQRASLPALLL